MQICIFQIWHIGQYYLKYTVKVSCHGQQAVRCNCRHVDKVQDERALILCALDER